MSKEKLPSDVEEFLAVHGSKSFVWSFSKEAIGIILGRIKTYEKENPDDKDCNWQDFFIKSKELWSEGVVLLPHDELKLTDKDLSNLDEIKRLKSKKARCSELIYKTAVDIAKGNGFIELTNARFLV